MNCFLKPEVANVAHEVPCSSTLWCAQGKGFIETHHVCVQ
jgi:hypothetical protein